MFLERDGPFLWLDYPGTETTCIREIFILHIRYRRKVERREYCSVYVLEYNPRPDVIINHPHSDDVYVSVLKDYTDKILWMVRSFCFYTTFQKGRLCNKNFKFKLKNNIHQTDWAQGNLLKPADKYVVMWKTP